MRTYPEVPIDTSFPQAYELEWLVDMPNSPSIERYYFGTGPILRVTAASGKTFLAIVPGEISTLKLFTWSDPHAFLAPDGWLVDTSNPAASRQLPGFEGHRIHYVILVASHSAVLIGHCCAIYCYGPDGLMWERDDLFCCDDPSISIEGETLVLMAHLHGGDSGDEPVRKALDIRTGEQLDEARG